MILSNLEIHKALDEGRLRIAPQPAPRNPAEAGCPYNTSSVDLRLGPTISIPKEGSYIFDLRKGRIAQFLTDISRHVELDERGFVLEPNMFMLGKTLEEVELPLDDRGRPLLAARIEGRSSFARCGLLIHFTAPTVHAGFRGTLTLEMRNLGPAGIMLFAGMPICQLIIEEVQGTPLESPSQFQGQQTPAGR